MVNVPEFVSILSVVTSILSQGTARVDTGAITVHGIYNSLGRCPLSLSLLKMEIEADPDVCN